MRVYTIVDRGEEREPGTFRFVAQVVTGSESDTWRGREPIIPQGLLDLIPSSVLFAEMGQRLQAMEGIADALIAYVPTDRKYN